MLVRFKMDWHLPRAAKGEELELRDEVAVHLLQRGVVEPVRATREKAVTLAPERAVHE